MGKKYTGILAAAICLSSLAVQAEEQKADCWIRTDYNESNGLPTGEANAVLQTEDGYIWIGSYGGLIRYDGEHFLNFSVEENGLDVSGIRALFEDSEGRLYIGTNDRGVYMYVDGEFSQVPCQADEEAFFSVRSFAETSEGTVYAGTTSGLAKVEDAGGIHLTAVEGTEDSIIYDLTCDSQDVLWGCSDEGRVMIVQDDQVSTVMESDDLMENDCYCVLAADDGCIYLGSSGNEVVRVRKTGDDYRTEALQTEHISTGELHTINKLYEDQEGIIWILAGNGMGCIGGDDLCLIPGQMDDMVSPVSMIQDYEGNLWAASSSTGVSCFSKGKYYNYNQVSDLEGSTVNAICRFDGRTYVGTGSGLVILDENFSRIKNSLTEALQSERVRHITCTSDGILWFSLYGAGLTKYEPETEKITYFTEEDGLQNNEIRMTLELQDGSLAAAGTGGINILKDDVVTEGYGSEELPYPFILCMFQAEDGALVAGSDGRGIYVIRDGEVKQYYREDGLKSGSVIRMMPDQEENGVWISSGSELYFWDEEGIQLMPLYAGAGSVLDIQLIGEELWLTKSNGLVIADKKKLLEGVQEVWELSGKYGLTGTLPANSWNWLGEDGVLWLCTNNGISMIDTGHPPVNSTPPKGAVTSVTVDDEDCGISQEILMPASAKRITLSFAALSYTRGEKYAEYYLEGFDDRTYRKDITGSSEVSYTNLGGGDYVFHLTVFNEDGTEGESCSISIRKERHLWESGQFLFIMVIAAAAVTALILQIFYKVKIRGLKRRQLEYQSIIEQSLHTFANAIDAKDKDTNGHSARVAAYSRELARRMELPLEEQEKIYYMALLHDIGKIGIPDAILKKKGKLTQEEWEIVKSHPVIGAEILKEFTAIPGIADGARYHHEFYDGSGYCEGLKGKEIPLLARIIAVADAFDAMCSKRYYHDGNTADYAKGEMIRCSGTQFDPLITVHMIEMIDDGTAEKLRKSVPGEKEDA